MKAKSLLVATSMLESGAGVALLISPPLAGFLLGSTLDTPIGLTIGRIAGSGLLALGVACWGARTDEDSNAAKSLIMAMVIYNVGAAAVLGYAGLVLKLTGIAIWPAVVLHALMAIWCCACLLNSKK